MASIELLGLEKSYKGTKVLKSISLSVRDKEFLVLVGPSGCGKSTLLRSLAGLEDPDSGKILFDGQDVTQVAPKNRDVAMVFQSYALYPHLNVRRNLSLVLEIKKFTSEQIENRVMEVAGLLGIESLLERKPSELSGGQKQRVAMGRALVRNPKVFLFDEPLSNLDAELRLKLRTQMKQLHQKVATTTIYVTHDQVEAMTLADRIVVMRSGVIEQVGTPLELYQKPANKFVASFIGSPALNFFDVRREATRLFFKESAVVVDSAEKILNAPMVGAFTLGLRPEHLQVVSDSTFDGPSFEAEIDVVEPMGSEALLSCRMGPKAFMLRTPYQQSLKPGIRLKIGFDPKNSHVF